MLNSKPKNHFSITKAKSQTVKNKGLNMKNILAPISKNKNFISKIKYLRILASIIKNLINGDLWFIIDLYNNYIIIDISFE